MVKMLAKAQRQQTAIDEEYTADKRTKKAEKAIREIKAAVRGRENRKEKGKETQTG